MPKQDYRSGNPGKTGAQINFWEAENGKRGCQKIAPKKLIDLCPCFSRIS
jgi:hypothetical protein